MSFDCKDCIGLECSWYTQIRGMHPQTGEPVDEWGCAVTWMPMLAIENSNQQRSTSAAVESFRNEMVKANESNLLFYHLLHKCFMKQELQK